MPAVIVLVISFFLAACGGPQVNEQGFNQDQLYQGYPCFDSCPDFEQGYTYASENKITDPEECTGNNLPQITGCKAYASDYAFDNLPYGRLVETFN